MAMSQVPIWNYLRMYLGPSQSISRCYQTTPAKAKRSRFSVRPTWPVINDGYFGLSKPAWRSGFPGWFRQTVSSDFWGDDFETSRFSKKSRQLQKYGGKKRDCTKKPEYVALTSICVMGERKIRVAGVRAQLISYPDVLRRGPLEPNNHKGKQQNKQTNKQQSAS